jgi:hypothetical protein
MRAASRLGLAHLDAARLSARAPVDRPAEHTHPDSRSVIA